MSVRWCRAVLRDEVLVLLLIALGAGSLRAQPVSLDGVTGGWLNPWALVSKAEKGRVGQPAVAYHFLDVGPIVGDLHAPSLNVGVNGDLEFGYSHYFIDGPTPVLSADLDVAGFKYNAVRPKGSRPAVSVGLLHRWSDARDLSTSDAYLVATRVVPIHGRRGKAVLANAGVRSSEAAIFGVAGRARHREALPFGTLAIVLDERLTVGVEATDQPGTDTNASAFVRLTPKAKRDLQILLAIAHVEDSIRAGSRFASSVSYRF